MVIGRKVLGNVVSSQIELHRKWGGIVPEAAARAHVEAILPVLDEALPSGMSLDDLGAIAVTNRPGLVGALSVGVTAAKALAALNGLPLIGVHHIEAHILSPYARTDAFDEAPNGRHVCLVVSGGHTELVTVKPGTPFAYAILGQTIDDAAGEAFDKAARLLGLGYPGGAAIQELASAGRPTYSLPPGLSGDTLDFSFAGFKTAVLRLVEKEGAALRAADAAASVQETICGVLAKRALQALDDQNAEALTVVGGVAANRRLRELLAEGCVRRGRRFVAPPMDLCTDNAAMIGVAASFRLAGGERSDFDLESLPNAELPGLD